MENLVIRRATSADAPSLIAFNQGIARETENRELCPEILAPGVAGMLDHPERGFYLVAEINDPENERNGPQESTSVIACLMVTYEWSDWRNGMIWWIQSVYVQAPHRRKGIYKHLYQFVQQLAEEARASGEQICGFRLYVEQDNTIAQSTYRSLGMDQTPYRIFEQLVV